MEQQEPKKLGSSRPWLRALNDAGKAFQSYQDRCKNIEKKYASLEKLASDAGDREFQIFWANMEVMKPSVYQRPPQPVIMPRHSDSGEVPRKASEMLERALEFNVEDDELHETMLQVRDDLTMKARGVAWVLDNGNAIHLCREDFRHDPARKWQECGWVARCIYLTKEEGVEAFGDVFKKAEFSLMGKEREDSYKSTEEKAPVWEIWSKADAKVIHVTEGVDSVLDEEDPYIDVKGFFPCPKPAYGTLQADTLLPVPDMLFYKDQIDEIQTLTARIAALSESLRMKGFYASGTSEVGEAVEAAWKRTDNNAILVPISNFAALGGTALKDSIVWMPVQEVAQVVEQLIMLRRQLMDDIYEITGLSDIMRGVTDANETLGAQNLKAQFGSIRVREKQNELVRIALEIIRIKGEIFAETFSIQDLAAMSGMKLPPQAAIEMQKQQIQARAFQQTAQLPFEQKQQAMAQVQAQMQALDQQVTLEKVDALLKNQKLRPFTLEIETDSTIAPNEQLEKETRIEFLQAMGGFFSQAMPVIENYPQATEMMAEMLKFAAGAFRANRDMGGVIDDFVKTAKSAGQQDDGNNEAAMKAQSERENRESAERIKMQELQIRQQEAAARQYDARVNAAAKQAELMLKSREMGVKEGDLQLKQMNAEFQQLLDVEELKLERQQARPVAIGETQ